MIGAVAVALAVAAVVPAAVAAPSATVRLTDTSVSPVRVRVDSGGTVMWRNTGRRSHRVTSQTRAFAPFTLAPGSARAIRFRRNGRHPYRVDGTRCGVVFVGVALGAACSPRGSGRSRGSGGSRGGRLTQGEKTHRYDITVRGLREENGASEYVTSSGSRAHDREWDFRAAWTSKYRNVALRVFVSGNTVAVRANSSFSGTTRITLAWRWVQRGVADDPINCVGNTVENKRAFGIVSAGNTNVLIELKGWGAWQGPAVIRTDCDASSFNGFGHRAFTWNSFEVSPNDVELGFILARSGGGLTTPVRELATGRAAVLDTGFNTTMESGCEPARGDSCLSRSMRRQRYIVVFTPRR